MNNKVINALAFLGGAAIGSLVTYYFVKDKYEKIAKEEIDCYKQELDEARKYLELNSMEEEATLEEIEQYKSAAAKYDYNGIESTTAESVYAAFGPDKYVIAPEDFGGEDDEFKQVTLTYYENGVLVDDLTNAIQNIDELVGKENLESLGEFDDYSVYVRNESLETDYEILFDPRPYMEVDEDE